MSPSKAINFRVSNDIRAALDEYCAKSGRELSDVIRTGLLKEIGRPDLADTMASEGRPPVPEPKRPRAKKSE